MNIPLREVIDEMNPEALVLPKEFDPALIGYTKQWNGPVLAVYKSDLIIEILVTGEESLSEEDAWEHYYFNIEGSYLGEHTPLFMHSV